VDLDLGVLFPLIAGRARSEHLIADKRGLAKVARGQSLSEKVVHHVCGRGSAAGPIGDLGVRDSQGVKNFPGGDVELSG
jgi:hypothetical protein